MELRRATRFLPMQVLFRLLLPTCLLALLASVLASKLHQSYEKIGEPRDFDTVLFLDLDNCMYPRSCGFQKEFTTVIPKYYVDRLGMTQEKALQKYRHYHDTFHSSLRGLYQDAEYNSGFNVDDYIAFQDKHLNYSLIQPDARLRSTLERVRARLIVFTNSEKTHAKRALKQLNIYDLFEGIVFSNFRDPQYVSKPKSKAYTTAISAASLGHEHRTLEFYFVDDERRNVEKGRAKSWQCLWLQENADVSDSTVGHVSDIEQVWFHLF